MRGTIFALAFVLTSAIAVPSHAAGKPRPAEESKTKKVWTNEDLDQLRARGLISIAGPDMDEATPQSPATEAAPSFPVYQSRLEDPAWYAKTAVDLRAELEKRQAALADQQNAIAAAANGTTQPGIDMGKPNAGITPESGLAVLQSQVAEVQAQLDELADLARINNLPPGVLRG
jgi:hypothetical protein